MSVQCKMLTPGRGCGCGLVAVLKSDMCVCVSVKCSTLSGEAGASGLLSLPHSSACSKCVWEPFWWSVGGSCKKDSGSVRAKGQVLCASALTVKSHLRQGNRKKIKRKERRQNESRERERESGARSL